MTRLFRVILLLSLLLGTSLTVKAQNSSNPKREVISDRIVPTKKRPSQPNSKLTIARRLISLKNYQAASGLLEGIHEENPNDDMILTLLITCYRQMKYYSKAELLTRRRLERFPGNLSIRLSLASYLVLQGKQDEGKLLYDSILVSLPRRDKNSYLMVIRTMISDGLESEALNVIDTARIILDRGNLYAVERGSILEGREQYKEATKEYLSVLENDTSFQAQNAERKLISLLAFEESAPIVESLLIKSAEESNSTRRLSLLTDRYLKKGMFNVAFGYARRQDSLANDGGQSLLKYIRQCRDRKAYTQQVIACQYFNEKYPQSPRRLQLLTLLGDGYIMLNEPEKALNSFQEILDILPANHPQIPEVIVRIGEIYYDLLHDYRMALETFEKVESFPGRGLEYLKARMKKPFCYLREGDLVSARRELDKLGELRLPDDQLEERDYYLALLDLYEMKFDSAEAALRKLMVNNPRGYYVNDAINLTMLLSDNKKDIPALTSFSEAMLYEERLMTDSAIGKYEALFAGPKSTLGDLALLRAAELRLEIGDSTDALENIGNLEKAFPDSYYLPYGLKLKADLKARTEGSEQEAVDIYQRLLEQFPNYPFSSEVRKRLRELTAGA